MPDDASPDLTSPARMLALTARIVSAHVRGNKLGAAELPGIVRAVHGALDGLARDPAEAEPSRPEPAVPIRRSVRPDAIVCLECGARMKVLKRHLATDHGLAPEEYRARWGLSADYPLVAPDYADTRSRLAKEIGLGRKRASDEQVTADVPDAVPETEVVPEVPAEVSAPLDEGVASPPPAKRRGRRKAATEPAPE